MRMFAPIFLFGVICRFLPAYNWCPQGIVELAAKCPSFLTGDFGLCVFGVLGVIEVVANWDDTIRELISESNIDTYVKPVFAALTAYSILTPEQTKVVAEVVGETANAVAVSNAVAGTVGVVGQGVAEAAHSDTGSSFWPIVVPLLSCAGTFGLCKVRAWIVSTVRGFDPDNGLHLNTLLTLFEEGAWLALILVLLVFPLLALLLMLVFAGLGWVLSRPLKKIAEKRRAYWDAMGRDGMLKAVRARAIVIFGLGALLSVVPVFGYLATVIALNLCVFGVIALYESRTRRIVLGLAVRFFKLTLFLVSVLVSGIPLAGIALLLPYVVSFLIRIRKIS